MSDIVFADPFGSYIAGFEQGNDRRLKEEQVVFQTIVQPALTAREKALDRSLKDLIDRRRYANAAARGAAGYSRQVQAQRQAGAQASAQGTAAAAQARTPGEFDARQAYAVNSASQPLSLGLPPAGDAFVRAVSGGSSPTVTPQAQAPVGQPLELEITPDAFRVGAGEYQPRPAAPVVMSNPAVNPNTYGLSPYYDVPATMTAAQLRRARLAGR